MSAKKRKPRHVLLSSNNPAFFIARSIERDRKSVFHILRRKKQLELGDEALLILDVMSRAQNYIQNSMTDSETLSFFSAQDVYLVTKMIEKKEIKEQETYLHQRVERRSIYSLCYKIDSNPYFQTLIALSIVGNTLLFATDTYPSSPTFENWREILNMFFFYIFLLEMIIKMLGVGLKTYFQNLFSIFDFIVVVVSVIEMILT